MHQHYDLKVFAILFPMDTKSDLGVMVGKKGADQQFLSTEFRFSFLFQHWRVRFATLTSSPEPGGIDDSLTETWHCLFQVVPLEVVPKGLWLGKQQMLSY